MALVVFPYLGLNFANATASEAAFPDTPQWMASQWMAGN
jgi:hypothetical protein